MKTIFVVVIVLFFGCGLIEEPKSESGVGRAKAKVQVDAQGMTVEQKNIAERLKVDNIPGSIKHLYVISAYSGQVLIYSTVRGKVTSGGKRLTPTTVSASDGGSTGGIPVDIGGSRRYTGEVLQDDGTYGHSMNYLYWFDTKGIYYQIYPQGGMFIIISSESISVKSITINLENRREK